MPRRGAPPWRSPATTSSATTPGSGSKCTRATGKSPVYRYLFDQIFPTATGDPAPDDPGAAHATDIEYVFHALPTRKLAWRPADRQVADLMGAYWTNFAKTGNPNGKGLPVWPAWDAKHQLMRINANAAAEAEAHRDRYEVQDAIEKRRGGDSKRSRIFEDEDLRI